MYKLIIVDDEQEVIDGISTCINWKQHNIKLCGSATDGNTAYNLILKEKPDVVITDIRMPGMNGLDLIEKVNSTCDNIKFIVFSGYSEFELAKRALRSNAVDYLVKPVATEELINSVLKAIDLRNQNRHYQKLVIDLNQKSEEIQEKQYYEAILQNKPIQNKTDRLYILSVFRFRSNSVLSESFSDTYNNIKGKNIISGNICMHVLKIFNDFLAIIEGNNTDSVYLSSVLKNSLINNERLFPAEYKDDVHFGVSNIFPASGISAAFREALDAVNFSEFFSIPIVHYKDVKYNDKNLNIEQWIRPIEINLTRRNSDEINEILDHIFKCCREQRISPINVKKLVLDLLYHNTNFLENSLKLPAKRLMGETGNLVKETESLVSLEDCKNYLGNFYRKSIEFISQKSISLKTKIIKKLKKYILNNLNKPITLDELADFVHKSPGYISKLFKDETGITVTQYITDQKISRAKEMLIQSEYKISDIAHSVGFDEERYFYQVFKKETGLTAGDYRKLHLIDNQKDI